MVISIATDIYWSKMPISHYYWHVVVKNDMFTMILKSSGQEWQFHTCYWYLVVQNGNLHIATDI